MKEKYLELTNTVYKLLEFFPESDPLKSRAKDKALAIMEHLILINQTAGWASFQKEKTMSQLLEDIDMLLGYLWIGKSQGWLNSVNCLIVSNEYEKIKNEIAPAIKLVPKLPSSDKPVVLQENTQIDNKSVLDSTGVFNMSDRQSKILEFLNKNERAQVMDLQTILPDITKRTIRRDLDELLEAGKILRSGDFNQVFYKINK
jgi:hypothetical protein